MATKKNKSTKSIKSAPVLRDAQPYKNSAGVKLPNADLIIEADASGAVTSCRDAVTGTEYVGAGGDGVEIKEVTVSDIVSGQTVQIQWITLAANGYLYGASHQFLGIGSFVIKPAFVNGKALITFNKPYWWLRGNDVEIDPDTGYSTGVITGDSPFEFFYENPDD